MYFVNIFLISFLVVICKGQYQFEQLLTKVFDILILISELYGLNLRREDSLTMLCFCRALTNILYQDYASYVVLFTELRMMAEGNVFVGTFSSNVARLMVLLREVKGWPRSSTLSVDEPAWYLGRRVLLT